MRVYGQKQTSIMHTRAYTHTLQIYDTLQNFWHELLIVALSLLENISGIFQSLLLVSLLVPDPKLSKHIPILFPNFCVADRL